MGIILGEDYIKGTAFSTEPTSQAVISKHTQLADFNMNISQLGDVQVKDAVVQNISFSKCCVLAAFGTQYFIPCLNDNEAYKIQDAIRRKK